MPKIVIEATTEEIADILKRLLEPTPSVAPAAGIRPVVPTGYPSTLTGGVVTTRLGGATSSGSSSLPSATAATLEPSSVAAKNLASLDGMLAQIGGAAVVTYSGDVNLAERPAPRNVTVSEAQTIIRHSEFSDKQRKFIKVLHQSAKPVVIDAIAKKMNTHRNSVLATKGNLVKRAWHALKTTHPPIFIIAPEGKNSMELAPEFRKALDELPVNIGRDW